MRRKKGLKLVLGRSGGNAHQRRMRRRYSARQKALELERQRAEEARKARIKIPTILIDGSIDQPENDPQEEKRLLLKALPKRGIFSRMINGLISLVVS